MCHRRGWPALPLLLSAITEIGFSGPFFTHCRKIGSRGIETPGWQAQHGLVAGDCGEHRLHIARRQGSDRDRPQVQDQVAAHVRRVAASGRRTATTRDASHRRSHSPVDSPDLGADAGGASASHASTAAALVGNPPRRTRCPATGGRSALKYHDPCDGDRGPRAYRSPSVLKAPTGANSTQLAWSKHGSYGYFPADPKRHCIQHSRPSIKPGITASTIRGARTMGCTLVGPNNLRAFPTLEISRRKGHIRHCLMTAIFPSRTCTFATRTHGLRANLARAKIHSRRSCR